MLSRRRGFLLKAGIFALSPDGRDGSRPALLPCQAGTSPKRSRQNRAVSAHERAGDERVEREPARGTIFESWQGTRCSSPELAT